MEKEKFDIQKKHTENIQELLEDTNARLSKMEAEYLAQIKATVSFLRIDKDYKYLLQPSGFIHLWILACLIS